MLEWAVAIAVQWEGHQHGNLIYRNWLESQSYLLASVVKKTLFAAVPNRLLRRVADCPLNHGGCRSYCTDTDAVTTRIR